MRLIVSLFICSLCFAQSWSPQTSNTTASLRGESAVDARTVWGSGSGGVYLRTTDGGATWAARRVPGAESLDFRGVRAFDANSALLMSIGPKGASRVYATSDAGEHWNLAFTHPDPAGFLDCMAFWDRNHGILAGDALDGSPDIRITDDGGLHWQRQKTPPALPNEGSFAASNSCVAVAGSRYAWFVTGGPGAARVFRSTDRGRSWLAAATPMRNDAPSAGIFSIAFAGPKRGVVVGGDYRKDKEDRANAATSTDGGRTWQAPMAGPHGFRSAVVWVPQWHMWIATGTSGSDSSADGLTWRQFDSASYNALGFAPGGEGWAVGAGGHAARFDPPKR